jgi:hypothetical protein
LISLVSSVAEIEAAIEKLPDQEVHQLATWFESFRQRRPSDVVVQNWLNRARGKATPGSQTLQIQKLTRSEE